MTDGTTDGDTIVVTATSFFMDLGSEKVAACTDLNSTFAVTLEAAQVNCRQWMGGWVRCRWLLRSCAGRAHALEWGGHRVQLR